LRWVEGGSGGPAVVFDAALGEPGSLAWAGVLPAVAEHTRVIAYDRAGVGASDPVSPLTVEGEVADLAALVSQAGQGRCVLAGHSWGGLLAQLVAFSHPDLVAGLVLVDPADEEISAAVPWPLRAVLSPRAMPPCCCTGSAWPGAWSGAHSGRSPGASPATRSCRP
jgi:pimeloyl-ACP methyl ester carboxylesterase